VRYLVMGDFFLDVLLEAARLTTREDMPTYKCDSPRYALGGAGNAAWCLKQIIPEARVSLLAPLGGISFWRTKIQRMCAFHAQVHTVPVPVSGVPALRMRIQGKKPCRIDTPSPTVVLEAFHELPFSPRHLSPPYDGVLMVDHGYGMADVWRRARDYLMTPDAKLLWDGSREPPADLDEWAAQAIIKLNEEEFMSWREAIGEDWMRKTKAVVVTHGRQPTTLYVDGELVDSVPVVAVDCPPWAYSGAGDAFSAAFLQAWVTSGDGSPEALLGYVNDAHGFAHQYVSGLWERRYIS